MPEPDQTFRLGEAQVQVLGPRRAYEETNNTSLVLMVTYGETRFLLTGDMESRAEQDLVEAGCALPGGFAENRPSRQRYVHVISVSERSDAGLCGHSGGPDNDYGHPREEVLSRRGMPGAARTARISREIFWRNPTGGL